jgi:hypothetical protein
MFFVIVGGKLTSSRESTFWNNTALGISGVRSCGQQDVPIGSNEQGQGWGYALGTTCNQLVNMQNSVNYVTSVTVRFHSSWKAACQE